MREGESRTIHRYNKVCHIADLGQPQESPGIPHYSFNWKIYSSLIP